MNLNSKIWIPGGKTGFIGKNLVKKLKESGYTNVFDTSRVEIDVKKENEVRAFLEHNHIDVIFMTAARVGGILANMKDQYGFLYENLKIQNNIVHWSGVTEVKKVVFLGSSCIYPKDYEHQPLKEEYLMCGPVEPTNSGYAIAKIAGLELCRHAASRFPNTHYIGLMPSNVYGPEDHFDSENSHALASFVSKICFAKKYNVETAIIMGTGKPKREWLHVDDLVDALLWSVDNVPRDFAGFLNVGTGTDISMIDLMNKIKEIVGWAGEIKNDLTRPDGMMVKCTDPSKINGMGWKAKIDLDEGLKKTVDWYLGNKK